MFLILLNDFLKGCILADNSFLKEVIMSRKIIHTEKAPKAIGPYSQAIATESMVYTAGQVGIDPSTGELVSANVEDQTRQVLKNLQNVLEAAGSSLANVVKTTVFLKDMNDFAKMNNIYAEAFGENPPARSTVAVAGLPKGALVEIEVVALIS
jgi:2-iminobutanoate/2-iminopropanoate deaminase